MLFMERQNLVIEHVGSRDRGLGFIQLGLGHLGVGIDIGLLIDPPQVRSGTRQVQTRTD